MLIFLNHNSFTHIYLHNTKIWIRRSNDFTVPASLGPTFEDRPLKKPDLRFIYTRFNSKLDMNLYVLSHRKTLRPN